MTVLTLNQLSSNLQEIYSALDEEARFVKPLVSNFEGTQIYSSATGWGYFWSVIYYVPNAIGADSCATLKLINAIKLTSQSFYIHLAEIQGVAVQFTDYLNKACEGYNPQEFSSKETRNKIVEWSQGIAPFLGLLNDGPREKVNGLFQRLFDPEDKFQDENDLRKFFENEKVKRINDYFELINLEGLIGGPLPYNVFAKLATRRVLSKSDLIQLEKFVDKLNQVEGATIDNLICSLEVIVKQLGDNISKENIIKMRVLIELKLSEMGCKLFKEGDSNHLVWRDNLNPGDILKTKKQEVVIGQRIGRKKEFENNVFFYAQNDSKIVVRIPKNRSVIRLEVVLPENNEQILPKPKVIEVENDGSYSIVERLNPIVDQKIFINNQELTEEQKNHLGPLVEFVRTMIIKGFSVIELCKGAILRSEKGQLIATKELLKSEFDFHLVESFIFDLVPRNIHVYSFLMEQTCLLTHHTAHYYKQIVIGFLTGKESFGSADISEPIKMRGDHLLNEIRSIRITCHANLQRKLARELTDAEETKLDKTILACYEKYKIVTRLPYNFAELIHLEYDQAK